MTLPTPDKALTDVLASLSSILLLGILTLLSLAFKSVRAWILKKFKREMHSLSRLTPQYNRIHWRINEILIELRAYFDADRACLYQFHNGEMFMLANPTWKLSCTYEIAKQGVTYESMNVQGLIVSTLIELVGPVCTGDSGLTNGAECIPAPPDSKANLTLMHFQVGHMAPCFAKHVLHGQGVRHLLVVNLRHTRQESFGFIGLHFNDSHVSIESKTAVIEKLTKAAEEIQFLLSSFK